MSLEIFERPVHAPVELVARFPGDITLFIKREDLIHPWISGNKWRKLKYNLKEAILSGKKCVLTFGGAFSNHIYATAAAGHMCNIKTVGVIRGEESRPLNATLSQALQWGMELCWMDRQQYRSKMEPEVLNELKKKWGDYYLLPEGGTNALALEGCREMAYSQPRFDFWTVSCGTGGTLAGLATSLETPTQILGFPALRSGTFLEQDINSYIEDSTLKSSCTWRLICDYHFGGYARVSDPLIQFIRQFHLQYDILLDPVYTGKMMYGVLDLINQGYFPKGSDILAVHTGGLQGIAGIEEKYGKKII